MIKKIRKRYEEVICWSIFESISEPCQKLSQFVKSWCLRSWEMKWGLICLECGPNELNLCLLNNSVTICFCEANKSLLQSYLNGFKQPSQSASSYLAPFGHIDCQPSAHEYEWGMSDVYLQHLDLHLLHFCVYFTDICIFYFSQLAFIRSLFRFIEPNLYSRLSPSTLHLRGPSVLKLV